MKKTEIEKLNAEIKSKMLPGERFIDAFGRLVGKKYKNGVAANKFVEGLIEQEKTDRVVSQSEVDKFNEKFDKLSDEELDGIYDNFVRTGKLP